jgi:hypothetical protein
MTFLAKYRAVLENRASLNRQILENLYWRLPVAEDDRHLAVPVGRGAVSSEYCGKWQGFSTCRNIEGHKGVVVKGVDCTGKYVTVLRHWWCHSPSCPRCFIRGWAKRSADRIVARLDVGAKRGLGRAEHITVSVGVDDRELPEEVLRKKCWAALADRGVSGASMVFHGYRPNRERAALEWSPHYHALGFCNFDECRGCVHSVMDCHVCGGFKGREARGFAKDGYLVKVHAARDSLFGTAWYQLHHATIITGGRGFKRFHIVSWWGSLAKRAFSSASAVPMAEAVCPACKGDHMERSYYCGLMHIEKNIGSPDYVPFFVCEPLDSSGSPNFFFKGDGGGGCSRSACSKV